MQAPRINPVAIDFPAFEVLGRVVHVQIHWYGLMYVIGLVALWWFAGRRARRPESGWTVEQVSDAVFYGALGVILGGRLGYIVFYKLGYYLDHPLDIFKVWEGGMSFHGGLLGVLVALWWMGRRHGKSFLQVTDFVAPWVPIGLGAGRIGNFINHELWGRVTDLPWGMEFAGGGAQARHPSQLYQAFLEGALLLAILVWFSRRPRPLGAVSGLFMVGYGLFRFLAEFAREPDAHLGFILGPFTMGQALSVPMVAVGAGVLWWTYRRRSPV